MSELEQLLNALWDDEIDFEDLERLRAILLETPAARQEYYRRLMLEECLRANFAGSQIMALHSMAVKESWNQEARVKKRLLHCSLGAAAILVLGFILLSIIFPDKDNPAKLVASADAGYQVSGKGNAASLPPEEWLELKNGVVSLDLDPKLKLVLEGPAKFRYLEERDKLELSYGKAFFQIDSPELQIELATPSAILRDVGTTFGVRVDDQTEEVHVTSGAVEIIRDEALLATVKSGESISFQGGKLQKVNPLEFQEEIPPVMVLLRDDFRKSRGTYLNGKRSDVGSRWKVIHSEADRPVRLFEERLDTSGGAKSMAVKFSGRLYGNPLYMLEVETKVPRGYAAKPNRLQETQGAERVALSIGGKPVVGLGGRGSSSGHFWFIESGEEITPVKPTKIPVYSDSTLSLHYDSRTGLATLYQITANEKRPVSSRQLEAGLEFDGVTVMNHEVKGDLALDSIRVKAVLYPEGM